MKTAYLVLGNQLLRNHPAAAAKPGELVIMIEANDLCHSRNYHKHKLILIIAAMRNYRDFLISKKIEVEYVEISESNTFKDDLAQIITSTKITQLEWMRTSDIGPHERLVQLCKKMGVGFAVHPNGQFMTSRSDFQDWYGSQKHPLMEQFYHWQRRRTGILMDGDKPVGGKWNFDADNRKPLPKSGVEIPSFPSPRHDAHTRDVMATVERLFPRNPGKAANFWLPADFATADKWLDSFIETRLAQFGPYEDASRSGEPFLFHSVLSPLINSGLLTPELVVSRAVKAYENGSAPLNSVEGFVRQIIGWREYMYGMYVQMPELMDKNYFEFTKPLEDWWYDETYRDQPLPIPVKEVLATLHQYGYNHHIERLMVLGNWFLLNEYDPKSVYTWFSSMYVDAYEWVMVPNVQGMSQYADGGVIATKPYISGGNYLQKMGSWWPNMDQARSSDFNTLYWKFLNAHKDKLQDNFRMKMILKLAEKMSHEE